MTHEKWKSKRGITREKREREALAGEVGFDGFVLLKQI